MTRLLVPFVPHIAEAIHRRVSPRLGGRSAVVRGEADSVQLARWPIPRPEWADPPILERMASVRALAALGLAARTQASLEAGRRLARAQVARLPGNERKLEELALLADLLVRALNVEELEFAPEAMARVTWRIGLDRDQAASRGVTPDEIELALGGLDPAAALDLATQIWAGLSVRIEAAGRPFTLIPPEITVAAEGRQGWAAAAGGGYLVVLEAE